MKKKLLVSVDTATGIWQDEDGGRWRPVTEPLPTDLGAVITWRDGAYLPQIAQLDAGERRLGWRWTTDDGGRWMTAHDLEIVIGGQPWQRLSSSHEEPGDLEATQHTSSVWCAACKMFYPPDSAHAMSVKP